MRITENRFRQYQLGTLSEEALAQLGAKGSLFRNPYFAASGQLKPECTLRASPN